MALPVSLLPDLVDEPQLSHWLRFCVKEECPRLTPPNLNELEDGRNRAEFCSGTADHYICPCTRLVALGLAWGCVIVVSDISP